MAADPRTPVLVGVGTASQRLDDPTAAREPSALMAAACDVAADDSGARGLLAKADLVLVPKGTWTYPDAARLVASAIGASGARTVVGEFGVLQTTLIERAASAIQSDGADVAIVVGGEAKWRELRATITGAPAVSTQQPPTEPDEVLAPKGAILSADEITARLVSAVAQYAMIEHARRRADGQSVEAHASDVAALWERFNVVARGNPAAWNRTPMSAAEIGTPGPRNRALATPYLKWHNSQWNVDQAACLILCSVDAARAAGVPEERWVFPETVAWSDDMVPMSERAILHRAPGFRLAGRAALEGAGIGIDDVAYVDLYSCFPIAVRTQALELGLSIDDGRPLTVTGGMTFAGGPLNNYVLQSTAKMAAVLREDPDAHGMVTAISAMITKQAVSLWSCRPPSRGFVATDVSSAVAASTSKVPVRAEGAGRAEIVTYTVVHDGAGVPERAVVLAQRPDGSRALVGSSAVAATMATGEWGGRGVELDGAGGFSA
jgi:acetyl-CoA C-acetyltransferase